MNARATPAHGARPSRLAALDPIAPGTPLLSARALTKTYQVGDVRIEALRGLDFELRTGELVVLLGASGSGKSTLLNILGGLDRPSSGAVRYRDQDLTQADERALTAFRRRHVGFVFQSYNLISSLTARENVAIVTDISQNPMPPEEALERVGLADRLDHFPAQLSGGEQQRVAIARAVAKQPSMLLCDEPTGALDSHTGIRVLQVIRGINRDLGTATAIITHNAIIGAMADRVIRLSDGRVVETRINHAPRDPADLDW
ncbi:MAG: ABC transporter ATP-binding protein [Sphingobacteriia bacterium]|nr:ABC transporter ATP-binding protein [Sphingobacteriia bacterium]NCC40546.1 ABC transporter ATP-binding protein [Gammaproteobacteria bacterium]